MPATRFRTDSGSFSQRRDVAHASRPVLRFEATMLWLDEVPLATDATWLVRHDGRTVRAHFAAIAPAGADDEYDALAQVAQHTWIRAHIRLHAPLAVGAERRDVPTFVVIDESTHRAVAAGTIAA
ncbi:MAG: hypothetical protein ABI585_15725 [Betaproteobacteria bacterium]